MLSIFAGLDKDGLTRYIGDVPRGAACGCSCEACGSPLVARHGDIKEWHFAHEASQERPECLAGAMNLLRRSAIGVLMASDRCVLPPYELILRSGPPEHLTEHVRWEAQVRTISHWNLQPPLETPVARIELRNGAVAYLHVDVADSPPRSVVASDSATGKISFWIPLPAPGQLRSESDAIAHVMEAGTYAWIFHPDVHGWARDARQRLRERSERVTGERESLRAWGNWHTGLKRTASAATVGVDVPSVTAAPADESRWITWRNPLRSFIFYGFKDGSSWLLMEHRDGRAVVVPWPGIEDGWEESFPARIGTIDAALSGLVLSHHVNGMVYLGSQSTTTLTASNASELARITWKP